MDEVLEFGMVHALNQMYGKGTVVLKEKTVDNGRYDPLDVEAVFRNFYRQSASKDPTSIDKHNDSGEKNYEIYVKMLSGNTFNLLLSSLDIKVDYLKRMIQEKEGIPPDQQRLFYKGVELEDGKSLSDYNVKNGKTLRLVLRLRGGGCLHYFLEPKCYDPQWNYDFRRIKVDTKVHTRSGHVYTRPLGSMRYAVKVLGKYTDNKWLGREGQTGEWPVAYHGTLEKNAMGIVANGFKLSKGRTFRFGKGIYCTPNPRAALDYATPFAFEGKNYRLIIQTRVNPAVLNVVQTGYDDPNHSEYWILPNEEHIRPYGVCIFAK